VREAGGPSPFAKRINVAHNRTTMDLGLTLTADDLAAAAAKDMTEKNGYGLERDVADLHEPLITSGSGRKHRMLPGGRWCVRPAQRQLWGDEQVLVRLNRILSCSTY
jgi:hypothetical protein